MSIKDLVPGLRSDKGELKRRERPSLYSFQNEMNRLFDDFFGSFDRDMFGLMPLVRSGELKGGTFSPRVNVSETDKAITIAAELPGMDEKDVSVDLNDDSVTISGERKEEKEEKGKNWHRVEQSYGSFHRVIPLPVDVDGEKAGAKFKKGVLTVTLPKRETARPRRKSVEISS